jgi:cytochrome c oxidase cbb3-type subunit III
MRPAPALACFAAGLIATLAGCRPAPGHPPEPMLNPDQVTDFAVLYNQNCAACHGVNGQNGPAIDLANPEYQALVDDASLRKWISGGMPGTQMPAFAQSAGGMLTDAQIDALIAGMRRAWSKPGVFAGVTPPPYAQDQAGDAHRGEQTYQARCASCHAPSPEQIISSDYLALVSDQALRTIVIAGRPDIGQPDWRHTGQPTALSAQEVNDLVAYFGSLRNPIAASAARPSNPPSNSAPSSASTNASTR